jgi:hypothetical protein
LGALPQLLQLSKEDDMISLDKIKGWFGWQPGGTGLPEMRILTECERFSSEELTKIEAHYEAKYVCESCVKDRRGGWVNQSVSIFYQSDLSKVPEGGSQWFGLFFRPEHPGLEDSHMQLYIVNAISAVERDIDGIVAKNGDVIYSRFRHDYRWSPDKSVMIDGGRDYTRNNGGGPIVTLRIVKDKLVIVEEDHG